MLLIAKQKNFSVADKQDATMEEKTSFVLRRYRSQQLVDRQQPKPFNEIVSGTENCPNDSPTRDNTNQQKKFKSTCIQCNEKGHRVIDCKTRKRELAQNDLLLTQYMEQRSQGT